MDRQYKFKFSIVTAVYNVEDYLEEAIESITQQDIGFEESVEMILIDDGSTDHSGEICDRYHDKFPNNIKVVHKMNGGVAEARNVGLKYIEGRFVNFMDSDDMLTPETLSTVYKFFLQIENEVDLVAIPLYFFEKKTGQHTLNYKFKSGKNDVIDLWKNYANPQMSLSSAFITYNVAKNIKFDPVLKYAEDAKVIMEILLNKPRYGIVPAASYLYRIRNTEDSAISSSTFSEGWYIDYLRHFVLWAIEKSQYLYKFVPNFVQYTLMYDLQWRFLLEKFPPNILSEEEQKEYIMLLKQAVQYIDDRIILEQKNILGERKDYIIGLKHENNMVQEFFCEDARIRYNNTVTNNASAFAIKFEIIKFEETGIKIEGVIKKLAKFKQQVKIFVELTYMDKITTIPCETFERKEIETKFLGEVLANMIGFCVIIPYSQIKGLTTLTVFSVYDTFVIKGKNYMMGKHFPLSSQYKNTYFYSQGYIVRKKKLGLVIEPAGKIKRMKKELRLCREIFRKKIDIKKKCSLILIRVFCLVRSMCASCSTWIISDRINKADDNGEALFKFICENHPRQKVFFSISKESEDYERISKIGHVVDSNSLRFRWQLLKADVVVSSQAEDYIINPFSKEVSEALKDIIRRKSFVFLQHGITKDNMSGWLNKYVKNFDIFVSATQSEYNSILDYDYYYTDNEVKLTGFPRHDRLEDNSSNIISIMPTWRANLVSKLDSRTGQRIVLGGFEKSSFYQMYEEILSDEEFIEDVEKAGYKVQLVMHPNMSGTLPYFNISKNIVCAPFNKPYSEIFTETSLLITDYSSVAFDFAYLRKPVIYYQPDREEIFSGNHTYQKGYFDYDEDGFGEVCKDASTLKSNVLRHISEDCQLADVYRKRIDKTFPFHDKNNCERVYCEIKKLKQL